MEVNQFYYKTILNTLVVRVFVLRINLNAVKRLSAYLVNTALVTINKRKLSNVKNKSHKTICSTNICCLLLGCQDPVLNSETTLHACYVSLGCVT